MLNKSIFFIIILFLLIVTVQYIYILHSRAIIYNGWTIGDWLINYEGGFVRRGLSGFLLLGISDFFNLEANITVLLTQLLCYVLFISIFLYLINKKEISIWYFIMILSPVTFLFSVIDPKVAGRKEIILFLLFAIYLLLLERNFLKDSFKIIVFSLFIYFAILFHELIIFYVPYFILAAYIKYRFDQKPFPLRIALIFVSVLVIMVIPLYLFGKDINGNIICQSLIARGLDKNVCNGILSWPNEFGVKEVLVYAFENKYIQSYGIASFLGILPFFFFIKELKINFFTPKHFFLALLILGLFSGPLFLLAIDWGRWINIHFILLMLVSTLFLKKRVDWDNHYFRLPRVLKHKNNIVILLNNSLFLILILSYVCFWSMGHFGEFSILSFKVFNKIIHTFKIIIEFIF